MFPLIKHFDVVLWTGWKVSFESKSCAKIAKWQPDPYMLIDVMIIFKVNIEIIRMKSIVVFGWSFTLAFQ